MSRGSKSITFQSITLPSIGRSGGYTAATPGGVRTPIRCLRLFVFAFLVPCILIAVPLYQRRVTLAPRLYTLTATDMRSVQDGISSVWCEAQELTSDVPFTSYRASRDLPQRSRRLPVTLRHKLSLRDDVKEFWGFYLLRGSRISVSACARWPGTSMLLVHGWAALNECVWVGQVDSIQEESSEEEEDDNELDDEILDPVRRQWRDFLRQQHERTPTPDRPQGRTEPWTPTPGQPQPPPRTQTSPAPVQGGPTPLDRQPALEERTDRPAAPQASGEAVTTPVSHTKDMRSGSQFVQRVDGEGRAPDKQRSGSETSTAGYGDDSSALPSLPSEGAARRLSPRDLLAPLTNDVIEREVQAGLRLKRASAVTGADPPAGRGHKKAVPAGRIIPLSYNGHRGLVNQTMAQLETSHSEMMSSFSSSEEALLNCAGVIVNQPLEASTACSADSEAAAAQITVQVIGDDYYYLVFSSENEVLPVDVFFDVTLEKTVYDVRGAEAVCSNSSSCRVPLGFWSADSAVVEYPVVGNASEAVWSEHYTVRSSCDSRGWVVAVFIVAALFSLFVCAFC